jgi:CRP/FNR family transcriptional regulator, cyclic AMP receptor protein
MPTCAIPHDQALGVITEFKQLPTTTLAALSQKCCWRRYAVDEVVLHYQDHDTAVHFIVQGSLRLTHYASSGHEVLLGDFSTGDMLGELAAIDGQERSATALAKSTTLLASMPAKEFLAFVQNDATLCLALLKRLTSQVRRLTQRVFDFSTLSVRSRVHTALWRMAKEQISIDNTTKISPSPTHADLANLISTHREAVTRELNAMAKERVIARERKDLLILNVSRLREMAQEACGNI